MNIKEICPKDIQIISPAFLVCEVQSFTEEQIKPRKSGFLQFNNHDEFASAFESQTLKRSSFTKKKGQSNLKRLIREQKVQTLVNRFIQKLKLNNINSKPIIYEPYEAELRESIHSISGIELPDVYEKILSIFIAIYIMICLFIDTTASLFPQVLQHTFIKVGQCTALAVFLVEFVSSCVVVKTIQGKKIEKITQIITNYLSDGLLIDFAYLVILITCFFYELGNFRLIILLKLPECFQRLQRIENTFINTFYKEQYWGLTKVFLLNFILAHFLSLLLILMAKIDPTNNWLSKIHFQNNPWYEQYIWSYYWGTTIMLTVGFGDLIPANYKEAFCLVLIETFSCLALAYNINCVGNLISNIKSQDNQKNKNIKTFKILSSRNNISEDLQLKIHNYIQQSTKIKKKFNFEEQSKFISTLPNELKADFLKESNKKIFQNLVFFKNLTQKTLLSLAEVIQTKICHPEEIIKKRGELSGILILKQGKIAYCTKLIGSNWSNVSIDKVTVKQNQQPYLVSLDFLSLERSKYDIKSEEYSILYFLSLQNTLQALRAGELDYEHFCFLRDRSRSLLTEYEVFKCQFCKSCHTKFDCPKLHYCPLKKHVIDINVDCQTHFSFKNYFLLKKLDNLSQFINLLLSTTINFKHIHKLKISKCKRNKEIKRIKHGQSSRPFLQLENNLKLVDLSQNINYKYTSWRRNHYNRSMKTSMLANFGVNQSISSDNNIADLRQNLAHEKNKDTCIKQCDMKTSKTQKGILIKYEHQVLKDVIKDEISQVMLKNNQVWLLQCDEIKNYKFYFPCYNASTFSYRNKKNPPKTVFR